MEGEWGPTDKGSSVVAEPLKLHIAHLGSGSCNKSKNIYESIKEVAIKTTERRACIRLQLCFNLANLWTDCASHNPKYAIVALSPCCTAKTTIDTGSPFPTAVLPLTVTL